LDCDWRVCTQKAGISIAFIGTHGNAANVCLPELGKVEPTLASVSVCHAELQFDSKSLPDESTADLGHRGGRGIDAIQGQKAGVVRNEAP
jgi:hypothetical protein